MLTWFWQYRQLLRMLHQLCHFDEYVRYSHVDLYGDVLQIQRGQDVLWTWHRGSVSLRPQHSALPSQQGRALT